MGVAMTTKLTTSSVDVALKRAIERQEQWDLSRLAVREAEEAERLAGSAFCDEVLTAVNAGGMGTDRRGWLEHHLRNTLRLSEREIGLCAASPSYAAEVYWKQQRAKTV